MSRIDATFTGPRWPYLLPNEPDFAARGLPTVLEWWRSQRLQPLADHTSWWSPDSQMALAARAEAIRAGHRDGGGYEWIDGLRLGDAESAWSLDLGCLAWAMGLARLRQEGQLPGAPDSTYLDRIETRWRTDPARAERMLEVYLAGNSGSAPAAAWYWLPLRLWGPQPPNDEEMDLLDTFVATLHPPAARILGVTAPLTVALGMARRGLFAEAAASLDPSSRRVTAGPLASDEVTYHRARYLWLAGDVERASREITDLWRDAPSYMLRALHDPVWRGPIQDRQSPVAINAERLVQELRTAGARWQRASKEMLRFGDAELLAELSERANVSYYEALLLGEPLQRYERWKHGIAMLTPQMDADLERLREFSETIPDDLPLRLSVTDAPVFKSPNDNIPSDLGILRRTVREGSPSTAAALARQLTTSLPASCRVALSSYGLRLLDAIEAAVSEVQQTNDSTTEFRLRTLEQLLVRCRDVAQQVTSLGKETGSILGRGVAEAWAGLQAAERGWVNTDKRAFGNLTLSHVDGPGVLKPAGNGVIRLLVADAKGRPVGGVPVEWSVLRGPATPVDRTDGIAIEWATSLSVGTALLRVRGGGVGEDGMVRARILGSTQFVDVPFRLTTLPAEDLPTAKI